MREQELFDVTIIGGGPAGLYSTFYSGLRGMKTKLIEYQAELGGKLHVYPEKMIWDVGGQPPITGEKLMAQLVEQGLTFQPTVQLNEKIISIAKDVFGNFVLEAESGQIHYSKTVIVAVGGGILNPQKLKVEGAERFEVAGTRRSTGRTNSNRSRKKSTSRIAGIVSRGTRRKSISSSKVLLSVSLIRRFTS